MIKIHFLDTDEYQFPADIRQQLTDILADADDEVRKYLPTLAKHINVTISPSKNVIPETGEGATAMSPYWIDMRYSPWHERPIEQIISDHARITYFHEASHATRSLVHKFGSASVIDKAIWEGLGTVFERDIAGGKPLWGEYDPEVISDWYHELVSIDKNANQNEYFFHHPDGRRWIAYRVGTYIVDRAVKNSYKSSADLVNVEAPEILKLANI